jgi:predicted nucleotidyltransferase
MSEEMEIKLKEITDKIVKEYEPEKIILFGSWAWGKPTEDSDVDLFIVKETDNTRDTARRIDGSIFPRFSAMDFIVYTPNQLKKELEIEEPFITKVLKAGKVLYEKSYA